MVAYHGGGVQGLAELEPAVAGGAASSRVAPGEQRRCGCADATHHQACGSAPAADGADDGAALSDQMARLALAPGAAAKAAAAAAAPVGPAVPAVAPKAAPGAAPPAPAGALPLPDAGLAGVAELIRSGRARRIVVMAGAGISVSAGIPDFRTPGTGLYSQLQRYRLPYPEAVFSIDYFRHDPKPFYTLAKELFPGEYAPTPAHFFLKLLADKGLLLRVFTQNIDGLEQLAGVPAERVVPAHGSFDSAHCIDCRRPASVYAVQAAVHDDAICRCDACGGLVKPDIVFFGEPLPARFHRRRAEDMGQADLLIVMGTSLVVQPFASMIADVGPDVPRLLINRERVGHSREAKAWEQRRQQQQEQEQVQRREQASACSSSALSEAAGDEAGAGGGGGYESEGGSGSGYESDSSSGSGMSGGFDFGLPGNARDAAHLGDADSAVRALAALLGWSGDLEAAIEADAAARAAEAADAAAAEAAAA